MRVSIHIAHFSRDPTIERGLETARAADDAQYIHSQLLIAGIDAEVVDGPVSDSLESAFWFVFEDELRWHEASMGSARRDRFVVLRPSGCSPFALGQEAAAITYTSASMWNEPPVTGALLGCGALLPAGRTLTEQLVAHLRSIEPPHRVGNELGPFPIGETFDRGAYRVESHLQGEGYQQLFLGRDQRSYAPLLVAFDVLSSRVDIRAFHKTVAYESPGVFPFAFVGKVEFRTGIDVSDASSMWALLETASAGEWLPSILGHFEPHVVAEQQSRRLPSYNSKTALPDALSLGISAGRILAAAAANGILLTRVRPEYMWARRIGERLDVMGLSARADAFFAMSRVDAVRQPVFDRYYYAPEEYSDQRDDRALSFSLAIMVAEWATGRFPYKYKFHDSGPLSGKHLKLALPKPLAALLSRGMRVDRDERPRLVEFLDELEALVAKLTC